MYYKNEQLTGADPGFPVERGVNPPGAPTYDFAKFSKKLHEIEKILGRRGSPLDSPLINSKFSQFVLLSVLIPNPT